MNTKSKKTLKGAALAAGLVAVMLPTGCASQPPPVPTGAQPPAAPHTVVAPPVD